MSDDRPFDPTLPEGAAIDPDREAAGHPFDALAAHLDGVATPAEAAAVRDHLARCPSCAADLALAERARDAVASLPPVASPGLDVPVPEEGAVPPATAGPGAAGAGRSRRSPRLHRRGLGARRAAVGVAGLAAAAAIVALVAIFATGPHTQTTASTAAGRQSNGLAGLAPAPVAHTSTNYSRAGLAKLADAVVAAGQAGSSFTKNPAPGASEGSMDAHADAAQISACAASAAGAGTGARILRLEVASFDGQPAYIAVIDLGAAGGVIAEAVEPSTCHALATVAAASPSG